MSERRGVRKFSDKQIKGTVTVRKCECCGHHEIGIHTDEGRFVALRPGMVLIVASRTSSQKRRNRIYVPTQDPNDWRRLLVDPEKHWRTGYSARALAHCWEKSNGFPDEITRLFRESDIPRFKATELLLAIPEHKVSLPGGPPPLRMTFSRLQGQENN